MTQYTNRDLSKDTISNHSWLWKVPPSSGASRDFGFHGCSGYRISNYLAYKAQWWECRGPVLLSKTQDDMLYPSMRTVVVCPLRPASNWCWGAVGIKFLSSHNGPNQSYIEVEGSKKQPSSIFWDLRIMKAQEWIDRSELTRIVLLKKSRKQHSKKN